MDGPSVLTFLLCAFVAQIIGTIAGFGAATILTPMAVLFFDMKTAIAVVACFHLFGTGSRLVFFGRHIAWEIWRQFGVIAILCTVLGASLTTRLSSAAITLAFGLFLIIYVVVSLLASHRVQLPRRRATLVGGGIISGVIAGLIGTSGAIRSACLLAFGLPKEVYLGTSAAIAVAVDLTRVPIYLTGHLIPSSLLPIILGLIAVAFAGAWIGQRIVHRVSAVLFRRVVMGMLAVMGLKLTVDGWRGLG